MNSLQMVAGNSVTVLSGSRALNAPFQPSRTRPVVVFYTVGLTCAVSVGGSQNASVELRCDPNANPTAVRGKASLTHSLAVGVGVGSTVETTSTLAFLVPPGHFVSLASAGNGVAELLNQTEVVL